MAVRDRKIIKSGRLADYSSVDPTKGVTSISGIRIYDVGQGDAICVLDQKQRPFLQIDYGGKYANPFRNPSDVDTRMPLQTIKLIMLTHWDEDHWCSAPKSGKTKDRPWLVPRQRTSPRAARFSATLENAYCVPEADVGKSMLLDRKSTRLNSSHKCASR